MINVVPAYLLSALLPLWLTVCFFFCVCVLHQITELSSELADERNTGESASQLLETETSERLRLEKDMKDLQVNTELFWRHHICSILRGGLFSINK